MAKKFIHLLRCELNTQHVRPHKREGDRRPYLCARLVACCSPCARRPGLLPGLEGRSGGGIVVVHELELFERHPCDHIPRADTSEVGNELEQRHTGKTEKQ